MMITAVQAIDIIKAGGEVVLEDFHIKDYGMFPKGNTRQEIGKAYKISRLDSPDNHIRHAFVGENWWPLSALSPVEEKKEAAATVPMEDFMRLVQALIDIHSSTEEDYLNRTAEDALDSVKHLIPVKPESYETI